MIAPTPTPPDVEAFIKRWEAASGNELSNYQLFVGELCAVIGVEKPQPSRDQAKENTYVFERSVTFVHGDGSTSAGRIDCYRRGAFVLEAKKLRQSPGRGFDDALLRARTQAEQYARALPAVDGRPPFLVIVDVGNVIELYAEFSRTGATYTPFPDPRSHRIRLDDLRDAAQRERLRQVWDEPLALDPTRRSARVTREIAQRLAVVAKSLEADRHSPEAVAGFLTRCLFSMFAEDVGLLPKRAFVGLLESLKDNPQQFIPLVGELWKAMDGGGFSVSVRADLPRFNGKLFKDPAVLPLSAAQIDMLLDAARANWRDVEPAIFGTLLERALDPAERHALGAHYTPRAYVERLVIPTVVEPLRNDWKDAQTAALLLASEGKLDGARAEVRGFLHRLCQVRVLDPACGSGNFLYVTLEHLKRLEGEVLNQLDALGDTQGRLEAAGMSVDPHQLLGIELNPRAAAVAETVLWIGYLQWHFRTRGQVLPPQPVLKDFHNIECRDAVLAYDRMEYVTDERGVPVSRWDGKTMKKHPITGRDVPDDRAQVPVERYVNPHKASWPEADFIVGNPPFIGASSVRRTLGDGYADSLRATWKEVPESADFVMHWWHAAAEVVAYMRTRRFGLIATNSLPQPFNRRVVQAAVDGAKPIHLAYAIADHPWVDSADGAAVRISMTVGASSTSEGLLLSVTSETPLDDGSADVTFDAHRGLIHPDLRIGANVSAARTLRANSSLTSRGLMLFGAGFIVTPIEAAALGLGTTRGLDAHIREYRNGRDLTDRPRRVMLIDLFGLASDDVRKRFPAVYQWLLGRVKPERDQNRDGAIRELWWLHGRSRPEMREALVGLRRYIATVETAKHRTFQFLDVTIAPDNKLIAIALPDAAVLGLLSSVVHVQWALASGSKLGVGNDPVYVKTRCFETFPFPAATLAQQSRIRALAEELDAHRKRPQAQHPDLTLTGMYNVLEKLKSGETLTAKEQKIHADGLVSVLKILHDEIDLAVLDAYGWSDLARLMQVVNGNAAPGSGGTPPNRDDCKRVLDDALLNRLVALNTERAAEEARGLVRWLRPEYQNPADKAAAPKPDQGALDVTQETETGQEVVAADARRPWPKELVEQIRAVARVLSDTGTPLSESAIAARFTGRGPWKKRLPQLLDTLVAVGRARPTEAGYVGTP